MKLIPLSIEPIARQRLHGQPSVCTSDHARWAKTTLARQIAEQRGKATIELEGPDLRRLDDADPCVRAQQRKLGVTDRIHRA